LSDIIPLRDHFSLLFFVSVGMLIDPAQFAMNLKPTLYLTLAVCLGKGLIFAGVGRLMGFGNVIPFALGLTMFQIGEFSFVLARAGQAAGALDKDAYALTLNVTILSMILTPFVAGLTPRLYALRRKWAKSDPLQSVNIPETGLRGHIVIAGGGRLGLYVARLLCCKTAPVVLVESSYRRVEAIKAEGFPVVFGDARQAATLEAAGIERASLAVLALADARDTGEVLAAIKAAQPGIAVVARAEEAEDLARVQELGVAEPVSPVCEAGLEMARQALTYLKMPPWEIQALTDSVRRELYSRLLSDAGESPAPRTSRHGGLVLDLHWIPLAPGGSMTGKTLAELDLRNATGASVVGVVRGPEFVPNPPGGFRLQDADVLAVMGDGGQLRAFQAVAGGS
jgi:monovalent cation:H+ antiporter-2, CPA2 family